MKDTFNNRESVWGWVTTTPGIVAKEIDAAANGGLSFFCFDWYYKQNKDVDSTNKALYFYHHARNKNRLKYCLMVANHEGYLIGPDNFAGATKEWLKQFKDTQYVTVDGKPLLIFFTPNTLVDKFGSAEKVKHALDSLRQAAKDAGFKGVTIAACSVPGKQGELSEQCGFDVLTGYNYPSIGFLKKNTREQPIDSLIAAEYRFWNAFRKRDLPYIPVSTLNWDPRPVANSSNKFSTAPYYIGYSSASVYKSVKSAIDWINKNPDKTVSEKIILLYAWNEYGEGAWLTPSKKIAENLVNGVKRALQ